FTDGSLTKTPADLGLATSQANPHNDGELGHSHTDDSLTLRAKTLSEAGTYASATIMSDSIPVAPFFHFDDTPHKLLDVFEADALKGLLKTTIDLGTGKVSHAEADASWHTIVSPGATYKQTTDNLADPNVATTTRYKNEQVVPQPSSDFTWNPGSVQS